MRQEVLTVTGKLSAVLLAALFGLGALHALFSTGWLPGKQARSYDDEIRRSLGRGDTAAALEQMRVAVLLRVDDPLGQEPLLRRMAETAHDAGDLDAEIFALRRLVNIRVVDRDARLLLATALLTRSSTSMAELKEAADNAEIAVKLDPGAVTGWLVLAQINEELGHESEARALRDRAARLAPLLSLVVMAPAGYWEVP